MSISLALHSSTPDPQSELKLCTTAWWPPTSATKQRVQLGEGRRSHYGNINKKFRISGRRIGSFLIIFMKKNKKNLLRYFRDIQAVKTLQSRPCNYGVLI